MIAFATIFAPKLGVVRYRDSTKSIARTSPSGEWMMLAFCVVIAAGVVWFLKRAKIDPVADRLRTLPTVVAFGALGLGFVHAISTELRRFESVGTFIASASFATVASALVAWLLFFWARMWFRVVTVLLFPATIYCWLRWVSNVDGTYAFVRGLWVAVALLVMAVCLLLTWFPTLPAGKSPNGSTDLGQERSSAG